MCGVCELLKCRILINTFFKQMKSNVCLAIAELANSIEITAVLQIVTFLSLDIFKSQKFIEAAVKI